MLNVLKLSELLAKNVDPKLYPRLFVMSPNGTLMAYSTPVDVKELRDQAALISMAWKEHEAALKKKHVNDANASESQSSASPPALETLTIEFQHNNIIVRALQPKLLLVLVGGVPPSRKSVFKVTPEAHGDPRYPPAEPSEVEEPATSPPEMPTEGTPSNGDAGNGKRRAASILSTMSQREKDLKIGALHIQRKKIDALTAFIRADFDAKGFVMPDDSGFL
ncbi:uncharacterized protein EI97DRAFT_370917 [Westerdykella ornata]|uniref:Roadblock/LAMTOR2 domain-containing protein n=1 Tax=Westerdykella ornata TaxID=318751 RepID=A0A6A6JSX8_WESOR|nr:uncharacterized protein EI97DRAFT_370917 [Westerdykella ornata]KAF2279710.1 hypothetical protein EI97DRAFT_370917 [Westerdykella ornata]